MSFASIAARALAAQYRVFGVPATYMPAAGDPVACTVIPTERNPDALVQFGQTAVIAAARLFEVRATEVPTPARGDTLTVDGDTLTVSAEPRHPDGDHDRALWLLECAP